MAVTSRILVEFILLGPTDDRRQLQDSPILGDVWTAFAETPAAPLDLLITPYKTQSAGRLAKTIADRIDDMAGDMASKQEAALVRKADQEAHVAYLQGIVAARLFFHELLRVIVPMTQWWTDREMSEAIAGYKQKPGDLAGKVDAVLAWAKIQEKETPADPKILLELVAKVAEFNGLDRYLVLAGFILCAGESSAGLGPRRGIGSLVDTIASQTIVKRLLKLDADITTDANTRREVGNGDDGSSPKVWQVSLNRTATPAIERSVPAVKADAAATLFAVNCSEITWAVVDSGIDATHPVFMDATGTNCRVEQSFDFSNIREIVSLDNLNSRTPAKKAAFEARVAKLAGGKLDPEKVKGWLKELAEDADNDRPIHWELVENFIKIDPRTPPPSGHGTHVAGIIGANAKGAENLARRRAEKEQADNKAGTNKAAVAKAGVTSADVVTAAAAPPTDSAKAGAKKTGYKNGMCPDIKLFDFRVLARSLRDTEFAVIAALQYIRFLNERHNFISVHGVNLSLSIPHDVRNFACGRTPVCDECGRLISSGVVVVAAAGNRGYHSFETKDGSYEGYTAFSITDPGNADDVITVGATHRYWPHTYGVSFFSSRGPTGDGRLKPDLVAPGERIESALPMDGLRWGQLDGTSMAAPHVSGAAAMLMARYSELIGQPRRIKRILCESATDLGRERSFQGRGMLDVLRAFQSI